MEDNVKKIFDFLHQIEKLKSTFRYLKTALMISRNLSLIMQIRQ